MSQHEILKDGLQSFFRGVPVVKTVDQYRNVPFVEVESDGLRFGIEIRVLGDGQISFIEVVSRDDSTLHRFSKRFLRSWKKGMPVYEEGVLVLHYLNLPGQLSSETEVIEICEVVRSIIAQLLTPGAHESTLEYLSSLESGSVEELVKIQNLAVRNHVLQDMTQFMAPKQLSIVDTLDLVAREGLSIARFGDGEMKCMLTNRGISFQRHDWKLMRDLRRICTNSPDSLLACFPTIMAENPFWSDFWSEYWFKLRGFLKDPVYGDSFVSRPQAFKTEGPELVDLWKSIWDDLKVCFVTGKGSRMDVSHEIFNNVKSTSTVLSKNSNAYDDLDNILRACDEKTDVDIFIIALGPAGTVLAYELALRGRRALDVGHLNNSYDNAFLKAPNPESIPWS